MLRLSKKQDFSIITRMEDKSCQCMFATSVYGNAATPTTAVGASMLSPGTVLMAGAASIFVGEVRSGGVLPGAAMMPGVEDNKPFFLRDRQGKIDPYPSRQNYCAQNPQASEHGCTEPDVYSAPLFPAEFTLGLLAPAKFLFNFTRFAMKAGKSASKIDIGATIANGHAFEKHVLTRGEFIGLALRTRSQAATLINYIVRNARGGNVRNLSNGRTAYWDPGTGTVIIRNPAASDGGTFFRPTTGRSYFDGLR